MTERSQQRGGSGFAIACLLMLLFLPMLYVLSIGPAAWTAVNYPATEKTLEAVYLPLLTLKDNCQPADVALSWYMELWVE